jgi:hypothetical protein
MLAKVAAMARTMSATRKSKARATARQPPRRQNPPVADVAT